MTVTEQIKNILAGFTLTEDGEEYMVKLLPAISGQQLENFTRGVPGRHIPAEISELLQFAGGFQFEGFGDIFTKGQVKFTATNAFNFKAIFPDSVELANDGFGNFWILDIDSRGNWGPVFYISSNPAVVVKHSANLPEFIQHLQQYLINGSHSQLEIIQNKTVPKIWQGINDFIDLDTAKNSANSTLSQFAQTLPANFVIADLRNKPNQTGFAWGRFGAAIENTTRHSTELLWGFKTNTKKGFLSKLFGR